jgi:hypothetical protein
MRNGGHAAFDRAVFHPVRRESDLKVAKAPSSEDGPGSASFSVSALEEWICTWHSSRCGVHAAAAAGSVALPTLGGRGFAVGPRGASRNAPSLGDDDLVVRRFVQVDVCVREAAVIGFWCRKFHLRQSSVDEDVDGQRPRDLAAAFFYDVQKTRPFLKAAPTRRARRTGAPSRTGAKSPDLCPGSATATPTRGAHVRRRGCRQRVRDPRLDARLSSKASVARMDARSHREH